MTPPWVVLTLSLLATALVVTGLALSARARDRARFERIAEMARTRVSARLDIYVALLRSAGSLAVVNPALTRAGFSTYVSRLGVREHYPGVQGIGLTRRIAPDEVSELEAAMRAQGAAGFRVTPGGPREEYHPILYLEPLDRRNTAAIGYDMFTEPVRREAMIRARDTGEPAMSGRVRLVQEIDAREQAGFLVYVPIYEQALPVNDAEPSAVTRRRSALRGFAYAPFRADDLFAGIFGREETVEVQLRLYDGAVPAPEHLLHDSRPGVAPTTDRLARLADTLPLTIAGRRWTMVATPAAGFAPTIRYALAVGATVAGLIVSIVLYVLARARRRAVIRIERTRDLLSQVLEQAPVAMCVLRGRDHVFELVNPRYRELVRGEPIGRPVRDVIPETDAQGLVKVLDRVFATGIPWAGHGVELRHVSEATGERETSYFNVLYHPFTGDSGMPVGIIAVAVDVTAETHARRDAELARREAEAANRSKSDFLAAMSHELRTPLNAITGYVQLMELGINGPVSDSQRESLDRIRRSAGHLLSLINDVLNFAKLEAGRVEFDVREVVLKDAVHDVVHMVEPQLAARKLWCRVEVPDDIRVHADAEKLRQILLNLLSNAVKFTDRGGVTVNVDTPHDKPGHVCLQVADTGAGIRTDRLGVIFDPFVQVDRTLSSRAEGTGLGLAISRDLARGMGADLTVQSVVGEGSVFSIVMRRAH